MEKYKTYKHVRFSAEVLNESYEKLLCLAKEYKSPLNHFILSVEHDDAVWKYDTIEEFNIDYRRYQEAASFRFWNSDLGLHVNASRSYTTISVNSAKRIDIETIFDIFERNIEASRIPVIEEKQNVVVFIGHGRSSQWRDLKDHLQDKHNIQIEAYETGARAGHAIRDILEDMAKKSSFAVLVMTAEDEQPDGTFRARQNVIHEAGLFQGKLGFSRAIVVVEDGVEEFSNINGVQQIRYSKNNIKETFGEVVATIRREFGFKS